jgi:hypothetical protein
MSWVYDAAMFIMAVTPLASLTVFLAFCRFVVRRGGGTSGLRDVAVVMLAFRPRYNRKTGCECSASDIVRGRPPTKLVSP